MKAYTDTFAENIKKLGKQQAVRITLSDKTLSNEDINSVTYNYEASLLKSVMKALVIDSNVDISKGTRFKFEYGILNEDTYEYINYGYYYVYSSEKKEDTGSYEIKAYDKMLSAMKEYKPVECKYPCTLDTYLKAVCNVLGYTVNQLYANMDKSIDRDFFEGLNYTYRDVLDDIAEVTGSTIYIQEYDDTAILMLGQPQDSGITIDEESFKDINVKFGEKYGPINSIVLSRSAGSDNVYLQDEDSVKQNGLCEIKIIDNQIMNLNNRSEYLPEILQKLKNISYYLNDYTSTGIMYLELLDYYDVKIGDNTYRCLMLNDEQDITQGLEEQIHTDRPETSETDYTKADKTDQRINQTYLIVDKQNQTINSLISSNTETVQKVNQLDASVEELSSKIGETADVTKTADGYGGVEITEVNTSEPIMLRIHPTGVPIRPLYPNDKLYPQEGLYPHNREIEFRKKDTDGNIVDRVIYNLPADLYWYSNTVYDEFVLDYENQKCYITRKTSYDKETDTVSALGAETTEDYDYPTISLTDGDYTVIMPSFETAYIYVRLMTKNIYTSQFATRVELNSAINQTKNSIDLGVNEKLTNYVTTTDMNSAINIKANAITSSVSQTYATKDALNNTNTNLETSKSEIKQTTDNIESTVSKKVGNDEIISKINQSAESIKINADKIDIDGKAVHFKTEVNRYIGTFTSQDSKNIQNIIMNENATQEDLKKYDINQNGKIDSQDWWYVNQAITKNNGVLNLQGTYEIDPANTNGFVKIVDTTFNNNLLNVALGLRNSKISNLIGQQIKLYENIDENTDERTGGYPAIWITNESLRIYDQNTETNIRYDGITTPKLNQTSLANKKKNFKKYSSKALNVINDIDIYNYNLKNEKDTDKKHLGFVIGENFKYSKEITNNDNTAVDLYSFISLCCKAIQEQQEEIEDLKKKVEETKKAKK